jgi:hypothetical protein
MSAQFPASRPLTHGTVRHRIAEATAHAAEFRADPNEYAHRFITALTGFAPLAAPRYNMRGLNEQST